MPALVLCLLIFAALPAAAAEIEIDWEYAGTAAHYRLYRNEVPVAKIAGGSPQTVAVQALLGDVFKMSAIAPDGEESSMSAAYTVTPADDELGRLGHAIRLLPGRPHGRLQGPGHVSLGEP